MAHGQKHALITGSSHGIGRGIALALAESGVKVAIHYYHNEPAARETLAQVRQRDSDGVLVQADVTRPEQITAVRYFAVAVAKRGITGQVIYADSILFRAGGHPEFYGRD